MTELELKYEKLNNILQELTSRRKARGIDFYTPNRVQYNAHRSTAKTIVVVKGNRLGGSTWGAVEISYHVTKKYPEWFPQARKYDRPIKIRISTDKFFKMDSVIEPKLRQYIPAEYWKSAKIKRSPQGYLVKIRFQNDTFIEFLSGEQDQMAWEGQDLDFYWGDEPVKRSHWVATQRGLLDRSGHSILSFTPLIEPWMKEEIVDKSDSKNIEVFYGTTRDNMFDIEGNPILREEDIARFENMLTEDEKQTRIHGKFFHLKGIVYKEFDDNHLISNFRYEDNFPVICVLDPHDRQPHWVIWAAIDRVNDIYIMYESIIEGTIKELAARILATEKYFKWNIVKRLIDPNFGRKPARVGSNVTVINELAGYRVAFTEANDSKETGRLRVKSYLHYNRNKPIDINNRPKLYFVRNTCPGTIRSMKNLQYDEWKTDEKDPKEQVKQKDTHGAHAIRYLCMDNPKFYLPMPYERQVQGAYY